MKLLRRKGKGESDLHGSIYRPKYRNKDGELVESLVYWVKYYKDGKPYRESTKTSGHDEAVAFLADRVADVTKGKTPNIQLNRVKFDDLAEDFLRDYRINGKKSLKRAKICVEHLTRFFGNTLVVKIDSSQVMTYIEHRRDEGRSNATINRELAALKRMLTLGAQCTPPKVDRVPHIALLKENNVRKDFFEKSDFLALREALPDYLRPVVTFAYKTGWRRGEILDLKWSQVDMNNWTARLNPGETKNDKGRIVYLGAELQGIFTDLWEARKASGKLTEYVFLNKRRQGKITRCDIAWKNALKQVGLPGKWVHDFRRTAVRNMVRANTPEVVVMKISGHRTRTVFDRYNIVSEEDLRQAAMRQEEYLESVQGKVTGKVRLFERKAKSIK